MYRYSTLTNLRISYNKILSTRFSKTTLSKRKAVEWLNRTRIRLQPLLLIKVRLWMNNQTNVYHPQKIIWTFLRGQLQMIPRTFLKTSGRLSFRSFKRIRELLRNVLVDMEFLWTCSSASWKPKRKYCTPFDSWDRCGWRKTSFLLSPSDNSHITF